MFEYFEGNYTWNMAVNLMLAMGASIGDIDDASRSLRPIARNNDDAAAEALFAAWTSLADKVRRLARADEARDRDGHVGAQDEHLAVLVEHAVGRACPPERPARDHGLILERRRVDLAVTRIAKDRAQPFGQRAQLTHLVGQDVSSATGNREDHGSGTVADGRALSSARFRPQHARGARGGACAGRTSSPRAPHRRVSYESTRETGRRGARWP